MAYQQQTTPSPGGEVVNAVKLVADQVLLPGVSLMMQGNVVGGLIHGVVGIAGRTLLGPMGWVLTGLNSYSKSTSGKNLWELGADSGPQPVPQEPPPQKKP